MNHLSAPNSPHFTWQFLTTHEAEWYIILVVCQTITFKSLDVRSSYLRISSGNMGQVRI